MKRIGVTGAYGFLGANFVAALLDEGRRLGPSGEAPSITAFASRTRLNPLFNPSEVATESLDVLDYEGMARSFSGLDALAHFAGRVGFRREERRAVWDTDVLGTMRVFDAALAAGVSRLLYVSSISALGAGADGALADEGSSPYGDPGWPSSFSSPEEALAAAADSAAGDYRFLRKTRVAYFDAKLAGWELAKAYSRDRALPVVTIFPGTAVGPGDLHDSISRLVDGAWEGRLPFSFGGATSFVSARDLGRGAVLALAKGRLGEGYVVSGRDEHNLGYVEFQTLVSGLASREGMAARGRPVVLPRRALLGLAALAERAAPAAGLSRAFVRAGSVRNACSSGKARAELGYEPAASLEPAILECRRFSQASRPHQATR